MAFEQKYIDRFKAEGFFRHVEWKSNKGVLVKLYDPEKGSRRHRVTFEVGVFDVEYDQKIPGGRQFYISRQKLVEFMINLNFTKDDIVVVFQSLNSVEPVVRFI